MLGFNVLLQIAALLHVNELIICASFMYFSYYREFSVRIICFLTLMFECTYIFVVLHLLTLNS